VRKRGSPTSCDTGLSCGAPFEVFFGVVVVGTLGFLVMGGCQSDRLYGEAHRPQFHFTPETGWMNDPNGLVYYAGEYHLFYQFFPDSVDHRGPKHWGHAVSSDLVHWQHLDIALYPNHLGDIWSGSAIVDWNNSGGFQTGDEKVLVAIYTHFDRGRQQQSIAYSNDRGQSWTPYPGNPVLPNPGLRDFRDPKVFWHEGAQRWVMILAAGDRVRIYTSPDLKAWAFASDFGELHGAHGGVWECPDLFPLAVDGEVDRIKWVMLVSVQQGAPNGGSGTQYFIGDFDGQRFTNSHAPESVHWLDYGRDNYAGVSFAHVPRAVERRVVIGWMSNWSYAGVVPTSPWRGAMTVPRELRLVTAESGEAQLVSRPSAALQELRGEYFKGQAQTVSGKVDFPIGDQISSGAFEILTQVEWDKASEFGLVVKNERGDRTVVGYQVAEERLFVDRRASGRVDFSPDFAPHLSTAPLSLSAGTERSSVSLRVFVDRSSLEVFADDGRVVITESIFPHSEYNGLELYAKGGAVALNRLDVWEIRSIWRE
jgi:fructan beta-fructosidase